MAAHMKFPCIAKILGVHARKKTVILTDRWHSAMAASQNWGEMRAEGAKLKKKFDDHRDSRPNRRIDL